MPEALCFSGNSTTNSGSSGNLHTPQAWIPIRAQYSMSYFSGHPPGFFPKKYLRSNCLTQLLMQIRQHGFIPHLDCCPPHSSFRQPGQSHQSQKQQIRGRPHNRQRPLFLQAFHRSQQRRGPENRYARGRHRSCEHGTRQSGQRLIPPASHTGRGLPKYTFS